MENNELLLKLKQIDNITNELDRIIALRKFDKEYKKTKFYKATRMSLKQLQATLIYFKLQKFADDVVNKLSIDNLSDTINDVLEGIDTGALNKFFDAIIDVINPQQLKSLGITLEEQVTKLQKR